MANAKMDENSRASLTAVSSVDGETVVQLWADPTTHRLLVDATGGGISTLYTQTPVGTINGINTDFTVTNTITFVVGLYMNGQFIHPAEYSFATTTITFVTAPDISFAGLPFTIVYY